MAMRLHDEIARWLQRRQSATALGGRSMGLNNQDAEKQTTRDLQQTIDDVLRQRTSESERTASLPHLLRRRGRRRAVDALLLLHLSFHLHTRRTRALACFFGKGVSPSLGVDSSEEALKMVERGGGEGGTRAEDDELGLGAREADVDTAPVFEKIADLRLRRGQRDE